MAALPELLLLLVVFVRLPVLRPELLLFVSAVGVALVFIEVIVLSIVLLGSLPLLVRPLLSLCPFLVAICALPVCTIELAASRVL